MVLARVIGDVVATVKDANLHAHKLLVVQPITAEDAPVGRPVVALDAERLSCSQNGKSPKGATWKRVASADSGRKHPSPRLAR